MEKNEAKKGTEACVQLNCKESVIRSLREDVHVPRSTDKTRANGRNVMERANGRS